MRDEPAPGARDERPGVLHLRTRALLDAEVAADRYTDPSTGLPRLHVQLSALTPVTGGPGAAVQVLALVVDGIEEVARRDGWSAADRVHRAVGAALRRVLDDEWSLVGVDGPGRYVVLEPADLTPVSSGPVAPAAAPVEARAEAGRRRAAVVVRAVRDELRGVVVAGVGARPVGLRAARVRVPHDAAGLARALRTAQTCPGARVETSGGVVEVDATGDPVSGPGRVAPERVLAEPVVSARSRRLRAWHVRAAGARGAGLVDVVEQVAAEICRRPDPGAGNETVWVDVDVETVLDPRLRAALRPVAALGPDVPRVGLRVHHGWAVPPSGLETGLRALAVLGARLALAGMSTGQADPQVVDTTLYHEVVMDAGLVAGAVAVRTDRALAAGVGAFGRRHSLLVTADGVDDERRARVAVALGAWYLQGAAFGAPRPLDGLHGGDLPSAVPFGPLGEGWTGPGGTPLRTADDELRDLVAEHLGRAVPPTAVRHRVNAERRFGRWDLAEVSDLLARVALG